MSLASLATFADALANAADRTSHPSLTLAAGKAVLAEIEGLAAQLARDNDRVDALEQRVAALAAQLAAREVE